MPDPIKLSEIQQVCERAHDELMRVTGMGKYAKNVRGGPPNPPRCTIPADPERDTDIVIGAAINAAANLVQGMKIAMDAIQLRIKECPRCGGSGDYATPEHDPRCDGSCSVGCPIPVQTQCEVCYEDRGTLAKLSTLIKTEEGQ